MLFRRPGSGGGDPGERFRQAVLPHLNAAFNLACWLLGNSHDAEDAVQDASVRAFASIATLREPDGRTWFLAIVRNTCMNSIRSKGARHRFEIESDEELGQTESPEQIFLRAYNAEELRRAIESLPQPLREVIVLREFEDMDYRQIAKVIEAPVGTVMSRLSRARRRLVSLLDLEVLS